MTSHDFGNSFLIIKPFESEFKWLYYNTKVLDPLIYFLALIKMHLNLYCFLNNIPDP